MTYVVTDHAALRLRERVAPWLDVMGAKRAIIVALALAGRGAGDIPVTIAGVECTIVCVRDAARVVAVTTKRTLAVGARNGRPCPANRLGRVGSRRKRRAKERAAKRGGEEW